MSVTGNEDGREKHNAHRRQLSFDGQPGYYPANFQNVSESYSATSSDGGQLGTYCDQTYQNESF